MEMPSGWSRVKNHIPKDGYFAFTFHGEALVDLIKSIDNMKEMAIALEAANNELVPLARFSALKPRSVTKINEALKKFKEWK